MRKLEYNLVDVFTTRPFGGNQLAVVTDGRGLSDRMMQAIAKEFNLSETTFVLPPEEPGNDFHVRIFTPATELPMAGHPTVGTAFVLMRDGRIKPDVKGNGGVASSRFEEGVGVIPVTVHLEGGEPGDIWMAQPLPRWAATFPDRAAIAEMLSLSPSNIRRDLPIEIITCGVPFLFVPLRDLGSARAARLRPDIWERKMRDTGANGVFVFTQEVEHESSTVHSRMFGPDLGLGEDPATGSASGPLGCYLVKHRLVPVEPVTRIRSEQGLEMGRPSFIDIEITTEGAGITGVRIGGRCQFIGKGHLQISE